MKSISKKIYLLLVLAVMSFCAVLFPMSANTAKAEVAFDLEVTKAQVKVQLAADESGNKEWAIMFKATIDAEELAAAEGTEVKFGMLIGPTKLVGDNATHAEFVADGFKTFSHVNSTGIRLAEGATGFDYWAGIRFNETILTSAENKLAAGAMELTAIPFYQVGEGEIVLGTRKAVESRKVLTQSYGEKSDANEEVKIPLEVVNAYAGQYVEKEAYICKSTDRLMTTTEVNGDLTADAGFTAQDTVFLGKVKGTGEDLTAILDDDLEVNGATTIVAFTTDGKAVYMNAKHAEKVITRYAASGTEGELQDYFVGADGKSIFYIGSTTSGDSPDMAILSVGAPGMKWCFQKGFEGLYVLASDITATKSFKTKDSADYGLQFNDSTKAYDTKAGFMGTLDGRGKNFDMKTYNASMSFFPGLSGATIKNIAFLNAYAGATRGAYSNLFMANEVLKTTFENVYIQFRGLGEFPNTFRTSHLFETARETVYNNVIIDCDPVVKANLGKMSDYYSEENGYTWYEDVIRTGSKLYRDDYTKLFTLTTDEETGVVTSKYTGSGNCVANLSPMNGLFYQQGFFMPTVTASNLIAVGPTPLHIFSSNSEGTLTNPSGLSMTVYMTVSKKPKYNAGTAEEPVWKTTLDFVKDPITGSDTYAVYTLDQFAGSEDEEWLKEVYAYAEDYLLCSQGGHVEAALANGRKVSISFRAQAGAYNMRTADQMTDWVKDTANAEAVAKFDSAYWVVDTENGTITWKGLSA